MPKSNLAREKAGPQHLTRVRALTSEVEAAISAIEHNDLRQLQAAVANQERISSELATTKWTPAPLPKTGDVTSETSEQTQAAYVTLAKLNRVYAGVLKRSKRSADLLSALYGNLGDGYGQEWPRPEKFQTLSCEV